MTCEDHRSQSQALSLSRTAWCIIAERAGRSCQAPSRTAVPGPQLQARPSLGRGSTPACVDQNLRCSVRSPASYSSARLVRSIRGGRATSRARLSEVVEGERSPLGISGAFCFAGHAFPGIIGGNSCPNPRGARVRCGAAAAADVALLEVGAPVRPAVATRAQAEAVGRRTCVDAARNFNRN